MSGSISKNNPASTATSAAETAVTMGGTVAIDGATQAAQNALQATSNAGFLQNEALGIQLNLSNQKNEVMEGAFMGIAKAQL